jgi:hypothetical protein
MGISELLNLDKYGRIISKFMLEKTWMNIWRGLTCLRSGQTSNVSIIEGIYGFCKSNFFLD